jgi:hypothetical protein
MAGADLQPFGRAGLMHTQPEVANITFRRCDFVQARGWGCSITALGSSAADTVRNRNIQFFNCIFDDNGLEDGSTVVRDDGLILGSRGHLLISEADMVTVHPGNIFRNCTTAGVSGHAKQGIHLRNGARGVNPTNVTIDGTIWENNPGLACCISTRWPVDLDGSTIRIQNNMIDVSSGLTPGTSGGLFADGPCAISIGWNEVQVTGNIILGNEPGAPNITGVRLERTRSMRNAPNNCVVTGNEFHDLDVGIRITHGTGHTTAPNQFQNVNTNVQRG